MSISNYLHFILIFLLNGHTSSSPRRPNFIIFLADDMGYGDIASYGHPTQERTFMDWMADTGLKFTDFYTAGAMCTPSRAALLTGIYCASHKLYYYLINSIDISTIKTSKI